MGQKSGYRVVLAFLLVLAIGVSLWFAAPLEDSAEAYNNQGLVYNNEGEYDKAVDAFTMAIELDPELALAYSNRGWAYIGLGQYEQGIADCTEAIELDPELALAYSNRGWAYIKLGQYEQGFADLDKAMELDPNFLSPMKG